MARSERLAESLNGALHSLFARHNDLYAVGEDIVDPYGGAFKITKGLSTRYPDRVLATPISENLIVGSAGGLALCGNRVIAEVMFGDFLALGFDQILNFVTKSVSMYGGRNQMRIVVRCPVGGHRGYGPTHSQSLQKHFIGIPHLSLYELTSFHNPEVLFDEAFDRGEPAIVFEPKVLYSQRTHCDGKLDEIFAYRHLEGPGHWVHVYPADDGQRPGAPSLVIVAPGGTAAAAVTAAHVLTGENDLPVHVLIPALLYPLELEPVMEILRGASGICVAEESTSGGTWGTEVARHVHERLWGRLPQPVKLLSSRDSVIPTAPHLERRVLLQPGDIVDGLRALARRRRDAGVSTMLYRNLSPGSGVGSNVISRLGQAAEVPEEVVVPKLNNNDTEYVLLGWLVPDGENVEPDQPIAEVETSKAIEELSATAAGVLRHRADEGVECRPGDVIALLERANGSGAATDAPLEGVTSASTRAPSSASASLGTTTDPGIVALDRAQQLVGQVVTTSRREIPDAFVLRRVRLDALDRMERERDDHDAEPAELLELLIKAIGGLREKFPLCFSSLADACSVRVATSADVGVTFDAGNGLFIPVVREVEYRSLVDIADDLAEFRMRAFRGTFTEENLRAPSIILSWNHDPGVVMVQPVIPPGLACAVSVGGALEEIRLDDSGRPIVGRAAHIGLAYDHRILNGREAVAFLAALAAVLEDHSMVERLMKENHGSGGGPNGVTAVEIETTPRTS
ncbi:2-oxo acid dehydrogenase subunit E2 [Streptomyces murinus]|uniref:2-oxo acid dehydrogenase subunit E2 n=1 Tax=Streptomyces murinus TaxID=33900 RepID=UPI0036329460